MDWENIVNFIIWAGSQQNLQNDMRTQQRLNI